MEPRCRVSFVVTSRNDDHGGGMLHRFGIFTDALIEQADRHGLAGELVVVEWNPPPGPRLHEVLKLRHKSDSFAVRFIEVPPAAHHAIWNSDVIPLFQMIAKNVGIRRARGEFVIATNPDILFSDALISFLATGDLRADAMYRLDRHDVAADVPGDATVAEQLAWCERHMLRVHGRRGSFEVTSDRGWWRRLGNLLRGLSEFSPSALFRVVDLRPRHLKRALRAIADLEWRIVYRLGFKDARRAMTDLAWRIVYRLGLKDAKRAMTVAYIVYGPHRVLRHAFWLGLRRIFGPPRVHTNGCGDFTMLSRDRWAALRGYPELPLWSMHLDSFLCYMAIVSGAREQILRLPCRMFHMEHGNSWAVMTPEERLGTFARKPWIDTWLLGEFWEEAYRTCRPIVFNDERWGLADHDLEEVLLLSGERHVIKSGSPAMSALEGR